MNSNQDRFLTVWMVLSILAGLAAGLLTYQATGSSHRAGTEGVRYFLLTYIMGWVILKVWHYVERSRPDEEPDKDKE